MNARRRMEQVLSGSATDRVARALWRHFPEVDFDCKKFVQAVCEFSERYEPDLIKVTPRSSFCLRDYGMQDRYTGDLYGRTDYSAPVIRSPEDWLKLPELDPRSGCLGQQTECLSAIAARAAGRTPVLQTIFSPLTQAKNLCGNENLVRHLRECPDALGQGLKRITENTIRYVESLRHLPVDGIFFAVQECAFESGSQEYVTLCRQWDEAILAASRGWLNALHLHGKIGDFDAFCSYRCQILHWDEDAGGISLEEGRNRFVGIVSGGFSWPVDAHLMTTEELRRKAEHAAARLSSSRFLLSPGCVIPINAREDHLKAFFDPLQAAPAAYR